ncbi:MAG: ribonuclease HII [Verrucomicrobiales bacterium]|nr:ribonuclease HII [Verrucomicrobiales bacterium]
MPDFSLEKEMRSSGHRLVAGIDEAGRGPLAGPVTAAAVILPEDFHHPWVNDSKKLSESRREKVYEDLIADERVIWAWGLAEAEEVDQINILQATYVAMRRAVEALSVTPDVALVDGRPVQGLPVEHRGVIKGDTLSLSIAAASIIAKVERDRIMRAYAIKYPQYGFEKHKGYGTKVHLEGLRNYGPCAIHRKSFAPVAEASGAVQ